MDKQILKFGCWPSKVSAEFVAGKALRFQSVQAVDDTLYWTEQRPSESGRAALVCAPLGSSPTDLLAAPFSARSKVHEYGGGAFWATNSTVFFVNGDDQQIWSVEQSSPVGQPRQITDAPSTRFADLVYDKTRNRLICVAEQHVKREKHPRNLLVTISLDDRDPGKISPLLAGDDFYASPRISPDGKRLAFLSWNLPSMPWEQARLQITELDAQGLAGSISIPNCEQDGASFQPEWDAHGNLWFINDDTGFGQLYRFDGNQLESFSPEGTEAGLPPWVFGMKTYGFLEDGRIALTSFPSGGYGASTLMLIDPKTRDLRKVIEICGLDQLVTIGNEVAGITSKKHQPDAIEKISCETGKQTLIKSSSSEDLPEDIISTSHSMSFHNEQGKLVYGNYYPPAKRDFKGPENTLPPVILTAHGGPTAFSNCGFNPKIQFWTSRGFGYFDINYSGSWGFGKAYRQRLDGQWGVRDVADMEAAARFLVSAGLADPEQLLISGSSAGGYTVLMALVRSDLFAAGASYYGISDLARLEDSTHKFEAGYLDGLLGLTRENKEQILEDRSPLFHAAQITAPVIFFQGLQDRVVPADQAELMVDALKKQGVRTVYKSFSDEGHGFRDKQTIETALMMEYQFYADILTL